MCTGDTNKQGPPSSCAPRPGPPAPFLPWPALPWAKQHCSGWPTHPRTGQKMCMLYWAVTNLHVCVMHIIPFTKMTWHADDMACKPIHAPGKTTETAPLRPSTASHTSPAAPCWQPGRCVWSRPCAWPRTFPASPAPPACSSKMPGTPHTWQGVHMSVCVRVCACVYACEETNMAALLRAAMVRVRTPAPTSAGAQCMRALATNMSLLGAWPGKPAHASACTCASCHEMLHTSLWYAARVVLMLHTSLLECWRLKAASSTPARQSTLWAPSIQWPPIASNDSQ